VAGELGACILFLFQAVVQFRPYCGHSARGVAISFLFVRAGCPHYGEWFFYVVWAFCPPVLQLVFCLCGQDAHTTVGGFFM
jgi:hypothetical protein